MTAHIWLPQPAGVPSPAEISSYLLQAGWKHEETGSLWSEYSKAIHAESVMLEVPQQSTAADYSRTVALLIEDLSRLEARSSAAVLREIRASSSDVIKLNIQGGSTQNGSIPVDAGRRVYSAARDLLLSAACSVVEPRAVFAKRKPDEAMGFLNKARFGQTEVGSFVLTMECSVPPRLGQGGLFDGSESDDDADSPFERKASLRLAKALRSTELAVRRSANMASLEPFQEAIGEGVSANLCDALAEILDATSADVLRADFSFASRRPVSASVPRAISFGADTTEILHEASRQLRNEADYPNTELVGTVVKLNSADATNGGQIVLRADVDGKLRNVSMALDGGTYERAIKAHKQGELVGCSGDLKRSGRSWVLNSTRDFRVIETLGD